MTDIPARAGVPFLESVDRFPDRPALTLWGQQLTYRGVRDAAERLAQQMSPLGRRIAILVPNVPAFPVALLAAWRLGATVVPLNARLREYEILRTLQASEATGLVFVESYRGYSFATLIPRLLPRLPALRACLVVDAFGDVDGVLDNGGAEGQTDVLPPEVAGVLYTSGTTGKPKGALVLHQRELAAAGHLKGALGLTPADVSILIVPVAHAFGMTCLLTTLASGGHGIFVESTFSMDPLLDAMRQHSATVLHGPPALFAALLKSASEPPASLRTGLVAGAPCPSNVLERLDDAGARILNVFGMTETGAVTCCRAGDDPQVRYTTCGAPLPGYEVRIQTRDDAENDTQSGEVQIRGPYVTPGYYRNRDETARAFSEGWFRTGDIGSLDNGNHLRISGRIKEAVQVAGLSVFPAEVEGFLVSHPDVVEAAVVGVPHEAMGEALRAFVVPRPGSDLKPPDLLRFARANIAGYKIPYAIDLVPELPHLLSGKPDRQALARMAVAGATGDIQEMAPS